MKETSQIPWMVARGHGSPSGRVSVNLRGLTSGMGFLPHLASVCREKRLEAGLKAVRIAATLDHLTGKGGESTVTKFEGRRNGGTYQPENLDAVVLSYAEELGINPLELWADALARALEAPAEVVEQELGELHNGAKHRATQRTRDSQN